MNRHYRYKTIVHHTAGTHSSSRISSGLAVLDCLFGMRVPRCTSSSRVTMTPTGTLASNLGLVLLGLDLGTVVFCLLRGVAAESACNGAEDVEVEASLVEVRRSKRRNRNRYWYIKDRSRSISRTYTSTCARGCLLLLGHVLWLML